MPLELIDLTNYFGFGLGNIFGTGIILGIFGLMVYFILAYKFQFPIILHIIILGLAGYFISATVLGDWVKALVLIAFGVIIATIGYKVIYG
jgi:hypothetical protein